MSTRDSFTVWLHSLTADEIDYRTVSDGRHILHITIDVGLYVRPDDGDLPGVIAGLRKLAANASEMAEALSQQSGAA